MLLSTPKFRIKQIDERQISKVKRHRGERFEHQGELRNWMDNFVIFSLWWFDSSQLVWDQISAFHLPTNTAAQFC